MKTDRKIIQKRYREKNIELLKIKAKEYRLENTEKIKISSKRYKEENRNAIIQKAKEYREKNKERDRIYKIKYVEKNKEIIKLKSKEYNNNNKDKIKVYKNNRKKTDPLYRLSLRIGTMIKNAVRHKNSKNLHTVEILGCSYAHFKLHLESKFESWMTWENYGKWNGELNYGWDIDHIIPISSAVTEEEVIKLNHYSNLKPLCSQTNRYIKKDNPNF